MRFVLILAVLLIGAIYAHPDQQRTKISAHTDLDSNDVTTIEGASGETSGEASGEQSGEASGEASGEQSGEASGDVYAADQQRSKRQAGTDLESNNAITNDGASDQSFAEFPGETTEETSGTESIEEASGEEVPVNALTITQLETLNTYAKQVHAESQKLIHQANLIMNELTGLSANAQNLGILSGIVETNSQTVLKNAHATLNITDTDPETSGNATCTTSAVCYNNEGCGSGKCIGALAGTCNCNSCLFGWPCQEDSGCGGFQGACNNQTATCDCFAAYTKHNLTLTQALTTFCNVATCDGTNNENDCFGLSCNYGFCVC